MSSRMDGATASANGNVTMSETRQKIVVIDDSEIVLELTRAVLERDGFGVVTCNSPIGATLVVAREKPALVLVDVDMASMSGERVVGGIKSGPRTAGVRVVLYSDRDADELDSLAGGCGADGFIRKGGDAVAFVRQVRRFAATAR